MSVFLSLEEVCIIIIILYCALTIGFIMSRFATDLYIFDDKF